MSTFIPYDAMKTVLRILALSVVSTFTHAATMAEQADALYTRGRAAEQRGDAKVAQLCYELAIRAKPDHQEAITRIAEIAKAAGTLGANNQVTGKLIIPKVQFSGATLDEALKFLREKSKDLDPLGNGVDIILFPSGSPNTAQIAMDMKNVPLDEALRYVTELAAARYAWDDGRVLVLPIKTDASRLPAVSASQPVGNATGTAAKWMLPKVQFRGASFDEVLNFVKTKSKEIDPLSKGLDAVILDAIGKPTITSTISKATITLELHQISMEGLLRYIAALAGVSIQIEKARFVVRAAGLPDKLPKTLPTVVAKPPVPAVVPPKSVPAAPASSPANQIQAWTNSSGVTIDAAFVGLDGDAVVIRKEGKEFTIPFSKLDPRSLSLAKKLSTP